MPDTSRRGTRMNHVSSLDAGCFLVIVLISVYCINLQTRIGTRTLAVVSMNEMNSLRVNSFIERLDF